MSQCDREDLLTEDEIQAVVESRAVSMLRKWGIS